MDTKTDALLNATVIEWAVDKLHMEMLFCQLPQSCNIQSDVIRAGFFLEARAPLVPCLGKGIWI